MKLTVGIEPTSLGLQSSAYPLDYVSRVGGGRYCPGVHTALEQGSYVRFVSAAFGHRLETQQTLLSGILFVQLHAAGAMSACVSTVFCC